MAFLQSTLRSSTSSSSSTKMIISRHFHRCRAVRGFTLHSNSNSNPILPRSITSINPNTYNLSPNTNTNNTTIKSLHSIQTRSMQLKRGFPAYTVYNDAAALQFKPTSPKFKSAGSTGLALSKRGNMLLEFFQKNPGGVLNYDQKVVISLSVEEMGLLLSAIPTYPIEISRKVASDFSSTGGGGGTSENSTTNNPYTMSTTNELFEKVLKITGDGSTVTFTVDFIKDGVQGGYSPPDTENNDNSSITMPMEVTLQAGEWEVVRILLKETIPHLLGWRALLGLTESQEIG